LFSLRMPIELFFYWTTIWLSQSRQIWKSVRSGRPSDLVDTIIRTHTWGIPINSEINKGFDS